MENEEIDNIQSFMTSESKAFQVINIISKKVSHILITVKPVHYIALILTFSLNFKLSSMKPRLRTFSEKSVGFDQR